MWYDPALSREELGTGTYNFDQSKKNDVVKALYRFTGNLKSLTVTPPVQAQRICNPDADCVDSFCQTWILFFVSCFIEEKGNEFLLLPFNKYSNLILKTWLYCLIRSNPKLKSWEVELKTPSLRKFEYCRLPPPNIYEMRVPEVYTAVNITKVETLTKKVGQTCVDATLERFKE